MRDFFFLFCLFLSVQKQICPEKPSLRACVTTGDSLHIHVGLMLSAPKRQLMLSKRSWSHAPPSLSGVATRGNRVRLAIPDCLPHGNRPLRPHRPDIVSASVPRSRQPGLMTAAHQPGSVLTTRATLPRFTAI